MSADKPANATTHDISLGDEDRVRQVLVDSVLGLWDVVNNLTRLKPSRRDRYRVTIFGSARLRPGSFGYEETKRAVEAGAVDRHPRRPAVRAGRERVRHRGVRTSHVLHPPPPVRAGF